MTYRYPGLRAFSREERRIFFARSEEIRSLYNLIRARSLSVLFAKSGTGKSSLLNAGVIPLLESEEYRSFSIRFQEVTNSKNSDPKSPKDRLAEQFKAYAQKVGVYEAAKERLEEFEQLFKQKPGLWATLRAYDFEGNRGIVPVIILDQFEEFFEQSITQQQAFIEILADLAHRRIPQEVQEALSKATESQTAASDSLLGLPTIGAAMDEELVEQLNWWKRPLNYKIVISIRSDRLHLMDELSAAIPAILDNRYQLHALKKRNAQEAIIGPALLQDDKFSAPAFTYSEDAVNSILEHLSNDQDEIESFQLQIICSSLEEKVLDEKLSQIENIHVGDREGIHNILNNYYEHKIQRIGTKEEENKVREFIETGLIIEGNRVSIAEAMILSYYDISANLLDRIIETRLIKPEKTRLGNTYELAHDTLIAPILTSYEKRKKVEEREAEVQRIKALEAKAAEEHEMLLVERKRFRRTLYMFIAVGILALVSLVSLYFAMSSKQKVRDMLFDRYDESYKEGLALQYIKNEYDEAKIAFSNARKAAQNLMLEDSIALIDDHIASCNEKLKFKDLFRSHISEGEKYLQLFLTDRGDEDPFKQGLNSLRSYQKALDLNYNNFRIFEKLNTEHNSIDQYIQGLQNKIKSGEYAKEYPKYLAESEEIIKYLYEKLAKYYVLNKKYCTYLEYTNLNSDYDCLSIQESIYFNLTKANH